MTLDTDMRYETARLSLAGPVEGRKQDNYSGRSMKEVQVKCIAEVLANEPDVDAALKRMSKAQVDYHLR